MKWVWVLLIVVVFPVSGWAAPKPQTVQQCEKANHIFQKYMGKLIEKEYQCQQEPDFMTHLKAAHDLSSCGACCNQLLGKSDLKMDPEELVECFLPTSCGANYSRQNCIRMNWVIMRTHCRKQVAGYDDQPWAEIMQPIINRLNRVDDELMEQYKQQKEARKTRFSP